MMVARREKDEIAIVVGTDFSPASEGALARAMEIAKSVGATLHLVHAAYKLPVALARALRIVDDHVIAEKLAAHVAEVRGSGTRAEAHLALGTAATVLRAASRETHAALVVVGTRGRIVPDAALGSTAERVASSSRVPVLLVRKKAHKPYREVVVAADVDSDVRSAVAASRLVAPRAEVAIVHVYDVPYESTLRLHGASLADILIQRREARADAKRAMIQKLRNEGIDPSRLVLKHGSARRVLGSARAGTLLVLARGRSFVKHMLLGSVSRWVVAEGASDVLLV